jgi:outer membrane usher protein
MAGADLFGTITRRQGSGGVSEFVVGLTRAFGHSQGLHVSREATAAGYPSTSAELSRSLPTGTGFGYRAGWRETDHRQMSGLFEYQRQSGRYEAAVTTLGQERTVSFAASGGLVALGRRFYLTRSVQDAFALVRVPGSPGVRVFASHQPIGRTNRRGELFVPSLQPYSTNELSIADDDVPLTSAIDNGERIVVPANRTAAVVEFPVRHVRSALGSIELMTPDGIIIPAFGELTVYSATGRPSSPLGRNGEFYLEDVPPGTYRAVVTSNRRRCEFPLQVPAEGGGPANLGLLRCTAGAER